MTSPKGKMRWEVNLAAVWDQMSTGGGFSRLSETMSTLGVPVMAPRTLLLLKETLDYSGRSSLEKK